MLLGIMFDSVYGVEKESEVCVVHFVNDVVVAPCMSGRF